MNPALPGLARFSDFGLFVLRVVVGGTFIYYGADKAGGGVSAWEATGQAMRHLGLTDGFVYWGAAATAAELIGGILLILGALVRLSSLALFLTMVVATVAMLDGTDLADLKGAIRVFYPLSMAAVAFALIFLGGGRFGFDGRSEPAKGGSASGSARRAN